MNKVAQRLLVFFIGIPIVLGIVLLDFYNYLPLNLILVICSATAAAELYKLFSAKTELLPKFLVCTLSALLPLLSYLLVFLKKDIAYSNWAFLVAAMILMAAEVFTHKTFETSNVRIASSIFIVFYSGFLFTFITRMTIQENATVLICVFLFTVFITDSLAWLFGVLLGKNNRGVIAASPNKSIAGFAGGFIGAIATCILAQYLWPAVFPGSYIKGLVLGILCAASGITGDLIESVFKRSAEIKDSGSVIPGRGGLLDSIDSILFTAPIYYVAVYFLF